MVVMESSLGFGVSGEMSLFSGDDFMSLLDWNWSSMGMSVSWNSPVRDSWCGVISDDWCCVVIWSDGVDGFRSLWQVGGGDDLESVVCVSDVFDRLHVSVSIDVRVSAMSCSVMRFRFMFGTQRIAAQTRFILNSEINLISIFSPVTVRVTAMSILSLILGGDCSVVAGCARGDEQCCNYLILVNGTRIKGKKIELTSANKFSPVAVKLSCAI